MKILFLHIAQVPRIYLSGRTTYGKKSGTTTTTTNVGSIAQPDELCVVHWTSVVGCRNFQLCKEIAMTNTNIFFIFLTIENNTHTMNHSDPSIQLSGQHSQFLQ